MQQVRGVLPQGDRWALLQRGYAADVLRVSFCGRGYMLFVGAFAVGASVLVNRIVTEERAGGSLTNDICRA